MLHSRLPFFANWIAQQMLLPFVWGAIRPLPSYHFFFSFPLFVLFIINYLYLLMSYRVSSVPIPTVVSLSSTRIGSHDDIGKKHLDLEQSIPIMAKGRRLLRRIYPELLAVASVSDNPFNVAKRILHPPRERTSSCMAIASGRYRSLASSLSLQDVTVDLDHSNVGCNSSNQSITSHTTLVGASKSQLLCANKQVAMFNSSLYGEYSQPDSSIYVLCRHPQYPNVTEVVDQKAMTINYRKISKSRRPWRQTFHSATGNYNVFNHHSVDMSCPSYSSTSTTACSSLSSFSQNPPLKPTPVTAVTTRRCPHSYDKCQLWEITSPCPLSFPLHCRDARGVIDPMPLTPMVLDRHQFCYRFHLSGNKMRWQLVPKKPNGSSCVSGRVEFQCFVRNTIVAVLVVGNNNDVMADDNSSIISGSRKEWIVPWRKNRQVASYTTDNVSDCLPAIIVFDQAFSKLPDIDADVVESFVLFTGIEVWECYQRSSLH